MALEEFSGRYVDDDPSLLLPHCWHDRLDESQRSEEIGFHLRVGIVDAVQEDARSEIA